MRLVLITALTILLIASTASAFVVSDPVRINHIRVPDYVYPGQFFPVYVNYEVDEGRDVENLKVRALVMDTGYYRSDGRFDVESKRSSVFDLQTGADASGWALVRVVVSNDDVKRIKHRWVQIR